MYSAKPLLFPDATQFADLFEAVSLQSNDPGQRTSGPRPDDVLFVSESGERPLLGYLCRTFGGTRSWRRVGKEAVRGRFGGVFHSAYAQVKPAVMAAIRANSIYGAQRGGGLKVTYRSDGTALVSFEEDLIIGGSWLALLPPGFTPLRAMLSDADRARIENEDRHAAEFEARFQRETAP